MLPQPNFVIPLKDLQGEETLAQLKLKIIKKAVTCTVCSAITLGAHKCSCEINLCQNCECSTQGCKREKTAVPLATMKGYVEDFEIWHSCDTACGKNSEADRKLYKGPELIDHISLKCPSLTSCRECSARFPNRDLLFQHL